MTAKRKNTFFILIILAAVLCYIISGGSVGISLDFGENSLSIGASGYDWVLPYEQITSLDLMPLPDKGVLLQGIEKSTLCCGTWKNEVWGEYTLCIDPKVEQCIVVTLRDGDEFILNYESGESTRQLHQMFTELLQSKGYLP